MKNYFAIGIILSIFGFSNGATDSEVCNPVNITDCLNGAKGCNCENIEFLSGGDQTCSAHPAIYEITFTYELNTTCNPELSSTNWSSPFAATHNADIKLWDACMADVSEGIAAYSMTGDRGPIISEVAPEAIVNKSALDIPVFDGKYVINSGNTTINLTVDKEHQYVTTLTMLNSNLGEGVVAGVAGLRLCNGSQWKERVRVCINELFSTNGGCSMRRNTKYYANCSLGSIEFKLVKTENFNNRTNISPVCQPNAPDVCPGENRCSTCCCKSSKNAKFYIPEKGEPECNASNSAVYDVIFTFTWSRMCHPDSYKNFSVWSPVWSWPVAVSRNTNYRMWDACMDNVSIGVGLISQIGLPFVIEQEFVHAGNAILNHTIGPLGALPNSTSVVIQQLTVDKDHQLVSAISNRGPTLDQIVGVADLLMCDGKSWKKNVKVCFELFSTAVVDERSAGRMKPNSVQKNNCSFGYIEFKLSSSTAIGCNIFLIIAAYIISLL